RAERQRGAGAAFPDAGGRARRRGRRRRARRSGLRRGDVVRNAAERRLRDRNRPAGDGAHRPRHDSRRDPLPAAARARLTPRPRHTDNQGVATLAEPPLPQVEPTRRSSALASAAFAYSTQVAVAVLSLGNVLIVARALGPAGRG